MQEDLQSFVDSRVVIFGRDEKKIVVKQFANFAIQTSGAQMEKMEVNILLKNLH